MGGTTTTGPLGGMPPGDALGGGLTQTDPTTGQPYGQTSAAPNYMAGTSPDRSAADYWSQGIDWTTGQDTGRNGEVRIGGKIYSPAANGRWTDEQGNFYTDSNANNMLSQGRMNFTPDLSMPAVGAPPTITIPGFGGAPGLGQPPVTYDSGTGSPAAPMPIMGDSGPLNNPITIPGLGGAPGLGQPPTGDMSFGLPPQPVNPVQPQPVPPSAGNPQPISNDRQPFVGNLPNNTLPVTGAAPSQIQQVLSNPAGVPPLPVNQQTTQQVMTGLGFNQRPRTPGPMAPTQMNPQAQQQYSRQTQPVAPQQRQIRGGLRPRGQFQTGSNYLNKTRLR